MAEAGAGTEFYGDIDFIPTEEYTEAEALRAIDEATFTVETARWVIRRPLAKESEFVLVFSDGLWFTGFSAQSKILNLRCVIRTS